MTSYIVEGNTEEKRTEKARSICQNAGIHTLDTTIYSLEKSSDSTAAAQSSISIGVSEIKILKQKLYLKPLRGTTKALVIQNAELLTIPAQNALLKVLEEPPNNTYIILLTERKEALLRTILSRCKMVTLPSHVPYLADDSVSEFESIILSLSDFTIGESLKQAEALSKNKQQAIDWLEKSILAGRTLLINALYEKESIEKRTYILLLRKLADTHTVLKTTNANTRLQLETMFLTLRNNT